MPKLTKLVRLLLHSFIVITIQICSGPFAANNLKGAVEIPAVQKWVPQDLSGFYVGRIYYGDKTGNQMIMKGPATLQILAQGTEFILTQRLPHRTVKGKIRTAVISDKPDLRVGEITPENDDVIEIRWEKGARNRFRLVRASGANRIFRFCTRNVTVPQCKTDL
jgi:hypothetical protein